MNARRKHLTITSFSYINPHPSFHGLKEELKEREDGWVGGEERRGGGGGGELNKKLH